MLSLVSLWICRFFVLFSCWTEIYVVPLHFCPSDRPFYILSVKDTHTHTHTHTHTLRRMRTSLPEISSTVLSFMLVNTHWCMKNGQSRKCHPPLTPPPPPTHTHTHTHTHAHHHHYHHHHRHHHHHKPNYFKGTEKISAVVCSWLPWSACQMCLGKILNPNIFIFFVYYFSAIFTR